MKRAFFLILSCIFVICGIYSSSFLPGDSTHLIEKKYSGWTGVIRIWASDDCMASGILSACASIYEKAHPGIYVNVRQVPGEAISSYLTTGINPPDIIVYHSSVSPDPAGLESITAAYPLRQGIVPGAHSVPILLHPSFFIYNTSVLDVLPGDMYVIPVACAPGDLNALTALCTGLRSSGAQQQTLPGVDIGLTGESHTETAPAGDIPCRMGSNLTLTDDPAAAYRKGDAVAFVGRAGDAIKFSGNSAAAVTGEYAFTDSAVMLSIIKKDDSRLGACMEYLDIIMNEGQYLAARAQAFPAVTGVSAWSGDPLLAPAEAALESRTWILGASGSSDAAHLYIEEKLTADEAMKRIIAGYR